MSKKTSSGQTWDKRYSEEGYAFGTEPNDFLVEVADRMSSGRVLVLGDGDGRNGVYLARRGLEVVTIDLSPVGVQKSQQLAHSHGVKIDARVGDLEVFDMGREQWDAVISIFCHIPSALRKKVHQNICDAVKTGGYFILEAYNAANIGRGVGGPQDSDMTVELSEIEQDFSGWDFRVSQQIERDIVEGKFHNGRSSVTQVCVRKP